MAMLKRCAPVAVSFALTLFTVASPAAASPIVFTPTVMADVDDTVTVAVEISGAADLVAWQFDLSFDASIVQLDAVAEGPFLSSQGSTLFISGFPSAGAVSGVAGFYVDLPPAPSGDGVLATLTFTALAPGISPLTLSNVFVNMLDSGFDASSGLITVRAAPEPPAVPEPSSLVLVASGVVLACRQVRRRIVR